MAKKTTDIIISSSEGEISPLLFELDKIKKPSCKLCNSDLRKVAEELYDSQKRKNYTRIKDALKNEHNFDISLNAVRNHLVYHHNITITNKALQEYADDINKWVKRQPNKIAALKARIAILEKEMFTIAQLGEDLDIIERRRNAETVKKLSEAILAHEDKLNDFVETVKPVNLIFNQLKIIVNDEIQHIDSPKTKKILSKVLNRLKDSVGTMIVE